MNRPWQSSPTVRGIIAFIAIGVIVSILVKWLAEWFGDLAVPVLLGVLLCFFGALLVVAFVLLPILVYFTHWQAASLKIDLIDPERFVMPQDVWLSTWHTHAELEPEGFRVKAHLYVEHGPPGASAFITMFENPQSGDIAQLMMAYVRAKTVRSQMTALGFLSVFEDGTELATANDPVLAGHPRPPWRTVIWLPKVRSPSQLWHMHQKALEKQVPRKKPLDANADPVVQLQDHSNRQLHHFVGAGYYYLDASAQRFRFTLKGAFLVTWKALWPVSRIYRYWRKRETQHLLRGLEIEGDFD